MRFGELRHRQWVLTGAGYSGLVWGAGFMLTVLLMLAFSGGTLRDDSGELHSTAPAWIFASVWTPYFFAQALLRARRSSGPSARSFSAE